MPTPLPSCWSSRAAPDPAGRDRPRDRGPPRRGRRTVRRYIDNLQELGIPVEGQRGVGGGYRLRPGYRLPPLMLSDDEVVMVVLGLAAARRLGSSRRRSSRERAREDPSRPAGDAPATGRGARGGGRVHELRNGGRAGRRGGAPARVRCDPAPASPADRVHVVLGRAQRPRAEPVRARRPFGAVVPRRARSRPRSAADVPRRPDGRGIDDDGSGGAGAGRVRCRRPRRALARERALALRGRGGPRSAARSDGGADPVDARRARRGGRGTQTVLRMRVESLDWMASVLAGLDCDFTVVSATRAAAEHRRARGSPRGRVDTAQAAKS